MDTIRSAIESAVLSALPTFRPYVLLQWNRQTHKSQKSI